MLKLFNRCPACGSTITVTECRCDNCRLEMRGDFRPGLFAALSDDQMAFLRVFLRARGNLTEVEKVLGISYPTIRSKLDEVNKALDQAEAAPDVNETKPVSGPTASAGPAEGARRAILQQVAANEITAAEALQKLREMQGGR